MTAGDNAQKRVLVCSVLTVFFWHALIKKGFQVDSYQGGSRQKEKSRRKWVLFTGTQNRVLNNKEQIASLANRECIQENQQVSHVSQ